MTAGWFSLLLGALGGALLAFTLYLNERRSR